MAVARLASVYETLDAPFWESARKISFFHLSLPVVSITPVPFMLYLIQFHNANPAPELALNVKFDP